MEMVTIILSSTLVSGLVTTLINIMSKNYINNKNNFHNKSLQVDNFFRNISNEELLRLLNDWHDLLYRRENEELKIDDKTLYRRTFFYGSAETIRRLSRYQSYMYSLDSEQEDENIEEFAREAVLMTGIIVSLKRDFSNEDVSIEDLMRAYLPWYDGEFAEEVKKQITLLDY